MKRITVAFFVDKEEINLDVLDSELDEALDCFISNKVFVTKCGCNGFWLNSKQVRYLHFHPEPSSEVKENDACL